jgi:hypothetical protein
MEDSLLKRVAVAIAERHRQALRAELSEDLAAVSDYAKRHGHFSEFVRDHCNMSGSEE